MSKTTTTAQLLALTSKNKTTAQLLTALRAAKDDLVSAAAEIGAEGTAKDGLADLAVKFRRATVPAGTRRTYPVSKAGSIARGDSVTLCMEADTGLSPTRFAAEDAVILTCASDRALGLGGVIFVQDGQTKLRAFAVSRVEGHEATLSNTVVLAEEALTEAALAVLVDGRICALYNQDGDGIAKVYTAAKTTATLPLAQGSYTESVTLTEAWTDIWMDGGDPENLLAEPRAVYVRTDTVTVTGTQKAEVPVYAWYLCVFCTRVKEGSADEREAALLCFCAGDHAATPLRETALTAEAWPCLDGLEYAKDAYAQGWALATAEYGGTCWLTYPKPEESGRGVLTFRLEEDAEGGLCPTPTGYADCRLMGSIPSAAAEVLNPYSETPGPAVLAHGVTRLNRASGAIESMLGVEFWQAEADGGAVWAAAGEENTRYGANISRLCCEELMSDGYAVLTAYAYEDTLYAEVLEARSADDGGDYVGGPPVALANFDAYAAARAMGDNLAALVYQKDGGGYIKSVPIRYVVAKSDPRRADGTAMADGLTGEEIDVNLVDPL